MESTIVEVVLFIGIALLVLVFVLPTKKNVKPWMYKEGEPVPPLNGEYTKVTIIDPSVNGDVDHPNNRELIQEINGDKTLQDYLDKHREEDKNRLKRIK
jgi:hypothetical protein